MDGQDHLVGMLRGVGPFGSIPEGEIRNFIQLGVQRRYSREELIFQENEREACLYVLLRGRVRLCKLSPSGQVSILTILEPVVMFNEVAAIDEGVTAVTAQTDEESLVWSISGADLRRFLIQYPYITFSMLKVMAERNRQLVGQFQNLSFRSVLARSAKLILELGNESAHGVDRRRYPNHVLAAWIATVPEAFSRSLKILREEGAVETSLHWIKVTDLERLQEIAQTQFV